MAQFRISVEDTQVTLVNQAFESARVVSCMEKGFDGKSWKAHALVSVCETFLQRVPVSVHDCIKKQEAAVAKAREQGKTTPKDESRIRQRIRKQWYQDEHREREYEATTKDDGRLNESTLIAGARYLAQCLRDGEERDDFTVYPFEDYSRAYRKWDKGGGFLLRIRGDGRTLNDNDTRPVLWLWMAVDIELPIAEEYARLVGELRSPSVEISEVIPEAGADWAPPSIAAGRVKAKG